MEVGNMIKVEIFVDGAFKHDRPGKMGVGASLIASNSDTSIATNYGNVSLPITDDLMRECSLPIFRGNNYAEVWAMIVGLVMFKNMLGYNQEFYDLIDHSLCEFTLYTDSTYVTNLFGKGYDSFSPGKHNRETMIFAHDLLNDVRVVKIVHNAEYNSLVDLQAKFAYNPTYKPNYYDLEIRQAIVRAKAISRMQI